MWCSYLLVIDPIHQQLTKVWSLNMQLISASSIPGVVSAVIFSLFVQLVFNCIYFTSFVLQVDVVC